MKHWPQVVPAVVAELSSRHRHSRLCCHYLHDIVLEPVRLNTFRSRVVFLRGMKKFHHFPYGVCVNTACSSCITSGCSWTLAKVWVSKTLYVVLRFVSEGFCCRAFLWLSTFPSRSGTLLRTSKSGWPGGQGRAGAAHVLTGPEEKGASLLGLGICCRVRLTVIRYVPAL